MDKTLLKQNFSSLQPGFSIARLQSPKGFSIARLQSPKGFTLVELLIAIVIIVILSTIGIASFNAANSRNELQNQAKEVAALMRNMRTDSVAAVKPITGAGTVADPSCKSPAAGTPDQGTYFGTYIRFSTGGTSYTTGVSCFDAAGNNIGGVASTTNLVNGVSTSAIPVRNTIFFSFDGNVYLISGEPTNRADANSKLVAANQVSNTISITFSRGGQNYYVYVNGSGLVCSQEDDPSVQNCSD